MNLLALFRRRSVVHPSDGLSASLRFLGLCLFKLPSLVMAVDGVITVGANVTFIASADGTPAPTFQWRKNGIPIPGATTQIYTLNPVALADAGTYQVIATNEAGYAVSPNEVLVVETPPINAAPVIVTQPAAFQTALVGASANFIVSASGNPTPTFQWQKNGIAISGATNSALTLAALTTNDSATYVAVATNSAGSVTSNAAVLVVDSATTNTAPVIVTQPVAFQTALVGASASLIVSASGNPSPTYQWQKNGVAIPGATNSTLTLVALTTNDSATYVAAATNSAGSVTSSAAVLAVTEVSVNPPNVAPTITSQPSASQNVQAGGSASFSVAAVGLPVPTYQWKKNGVLIPGATNATFALQFVTTNDSASYTAVASNIAGAATSNAAVLTVSATVTNPPPPPAPPPASTTAAPTITSQPALTQTVVAGSSASFTAVAVGNPTPRFQWRKNGANISGATDGTLSINSVTAADAGIYSVLASNTAGTVVSDNSALIVQTRPVITVQPIPLAVIGGSTARFSVSVSAIPGAMLQWHKNGTPIPGATSALLMLGSIGSSDVGEYSVVATNTLGSTASNTAGLIIGAPPVITTQPTSQTVSAKTNVALTTTASGSPAPSFQWKKNGSKINGATQATLSLKSVSKGDSGLYSVEATNVAGWVSSSVAILTVNTAAGKGSTDGDDGDGITNPDGSTGPSGDPMAAGLVNLSVRATAGAGNSALIVGFVINGSSTKPVLIRGIGPTLRDFGISGALLDPRLALYSGSVIAAANDDWNTNDNAAQIVGTSIRVGAFSLPDRAPDSALMTTLETGAYTVQLSGKDASNGIALVEVYDAASGNAAKLVNLSVRAHIGNGSESPNVGFVIAGTTPRRVMIRAVGPGLATFAVADAIVDPQIELFKGNSRIDQNDNWGGSPALSALFGQVGAFGLSDVASRDAVLLVSLEPGAYTVVVSGANGATGVGLVELYEIP